MTGKKKDKNELSQFFNDRVPLKITILVGALFAVLAVFIWQRYHERDQIYQSSASAMNDLKPPQPPKDILDQIKNLRSQPIQNKIPEQPGPPAKIGPFRVPILMYHYIEYVTDTRDTIRQSLDIRPITFEDQLKTLINANYTFLTASEFADILAGKRNMPTNPILLTFDDGYRDFYTDAYPLLKKYHVNATAYIISGVLDKPNYMFNWQVREIASDGLVEIAAHTVHHLWLKGLPPAKVQEEIFGSKAQLEKLIGKPVVSFAYPYGAFDSGTIALVQQAGFTSAVSTLPGITQGQENKFYLFRLRPGGATGNVLLSWLNTEINKPVQKSASASATR